MQKLNLFCFILGIGSYVLLITDILGTHRPSVQWDWFIKSSVVGKAKLDLKILQYEYNSIINKYNGVRWQSPRNVTICLINFEEFLLHHHSNIVIVLISSWWDSGKQYRLVGEGAIAIQLLWQLRPCCQPSKDGLESLGKFLEINKKSCVINKIKLATLVKVLQLLAFLLLEKYKVRVSVQISTFKMKI